MIFLLFSLLKAYSLSSDFEIKSYSSLKVINFSNSEELTPEVKLKLRELVWTALYKTQSSRHCTPSFSVRFENEQVTLCQENQKLNRDLHTIRSAIKAKK